MVPPSVNLGNATKVYLLHYIKEIFISLLVNKSVKKLSKEI